MTEHVCCPELWDGAHSFSRCRLGGELTGSFSPAQGVGWGSGQLELAVAFPWDCSVS